MIAYINSQAAKAVVLKTISDHASRTVRLSAMNAYLYNNGDSAEAIAAARQHSKPEEVKFIGIPRLSPRYGSQGFYGPFGALLHGTPGGTRSSTYSQVARRNPEKRTS